VELRVRGDDDWVGLLSGENRSYLEEKLLPAFLVRQRWFGAKSRLIHSVSLVNWGVFDDSKSALVLTDVTYRDGEAESYLLPLGMSFGFAAADLEARFPGAVVSPLRSMQDTGVLRDGLFSPAALSALLALIAEAGSIRMERGIANGVPSGILGDLCGDGAPLTPRLSATEQSNSSIFFGDRLILKLFRKQQPGTNPDTEIGRYLTEHGGFRNIALFGGSIEYLLDNSSGDATYTFAMLQGLVANEGDGWNWMLGELERYYASAAEAEFPGSDAELPETVRSAMDNSLDAAATLGRRTGELHLALGQATGEADFRPEPFTLGDAESLREEVLSKAARGFDLLQASLAGLPEDAIALAMSVLSARQALLVRLGALVEAGVGGQRIRVHGDYHLGQVLRTGLDFVILDFEGEPARSLAERRAKQSPLKDVAGMLRSFSYAAFAGLTRFVESASRNTEQLDPWARLWERAASAKFLQAYRTAVGDSPIIPSSSGFPSGSGFQSLLDAYVLDKALYELVYELNNRPDWVRIPLHGILSLMPSEE
jgi:maltose alpha-D-glucosyltransferase/alpha-amylase